MPLPQIVKDLGTFERTVTIWFRRADADDGARPGPGTTESAALRELRKRSRLLEQENEILRGPLAGR